MRRNRFVHFLTIMVAQCLLLFLMPQCTTEPPKDAKDANYLTFTAEADSTLFAIANIGGNHPDVQYSLDGGKTWTILTSDTLIYLVRKGDKALLKGNNPKGFSKKERVYSIFYMEGSIAASGSVMSLIDGKGITTKIPNSFCFKNLFRGPSLTQAPELPAKKLAGHCYEGMFEECINLTQAPQLPATKLAEECYAGMFDYCINLTQAPQLPATKLERYCYSGMFRECTNLKQAPQLPATKLAEGCYTGMFSQCYNLTQAPQLPATKLEKYCYSGMFEECFELTQAPQLPATKLEKYCYEGMFRCCHSLTQAPQLPATKLEKYCYSGMFCWCNHLTQAPQLPATKLENYCYRGMFSCCHSLTQAPELSAQTLANGCYKKMFYDCTSLAEIKVGFTAWTKHNWFWGNESSTRSWLSGVAPNGKFICPQKLPKEFGKSRIPEGWKVIKN